MKYTRKYTLDELLETCRSEEPDSDSLLNASQVVPAMLGEALPCGFEAPATVHPEPALAMVILNMTGMATPSEARALCAAVLRECDKIDGGVEPARSW